MVGQYLSLKDLQDRRIVNNTATLNRWIATLGLVVPHRVV